MPEIVGEVLTDEERVRLLEAAAADERAGRLERCYLPQQVRDLIAQIRGLDS